MSEQVNSPETAAANRTQVAKKTISHKLKDRLILLSLIIVCILIALSSFLPKHKATTAIEEEKEDISNTLHQNMEMIAKLKEKRERGEGYHGQDPSYPPILKPISLNPAASQETMARMNAPSTFFAKDAETNSKASVKAEQGRTLTGPDGNSEFLNQQNDIALVSAKHLPHPAFTVPAGEMIPATMETAINSELAGMVRAITSRDIFALSGNKILIPKGSTLVGQFNASISQGQSRIFIVWNRIQMSNGIIATLNSPSADTLGRSGQAADYINRHFFQRFANSALLSVLGAYTATAGVHGQDEYNSMSQYRMNIAEGFQQSASQSLQQDMQIRPTLALNQGASINVFVAHDLDFYRVQGIK